MEVTAAMVNELRKKTGLPMMECKQALVESEGDTERAIQILREKGKLKGAKMADREAGEGRVGIYADPASRIAGIVELRCETAPVANTKDFIDLTNTLARQVAHAEAPTVDNIREMKLLDDASRTVGDLMDEVFNRCRENMKIARLEKVVGTTGHYVHFDGQKGALIEFTAEAPEELATGVAMHVTALNPPVAQRDEADPQEVEQQRAAFAEEAKGKPPQVAEKIIEGKLGRWYSTFVLLDQPYVKDDKKSVGEALRDANPELSVKRFVRYEVGRR